MRTVICTLPEGGDITVHVGELSRAYRGGDVEDLDRVLAPARAATDTQPSRPAFTVAEALGEHLAHFRPADEDPRPAAPSTPDPADHEESR